MNVPVAVVVCVAPICGSVPASNVPLALVSRNSLTSAPARPVSEPFWTPLPSRSLTTLPLMTTFVALTVVVAVAELLPTTLSLGDVTVAVFVRVVAAAGAVTTMSKLAELAAASEGRVHVTGDAALHVQAVPAAETKVVPAGIVSETLTLFAVTVDGFVT